MLRAPSCVPRLSTVCHSLSAVRHRRLGQKNNELVALKRMKGTFKTWDECLKLREIQSLKGLQCANVVRLIEAVSTVEYPRVPYSTPAVRARGGAPL